MILRDLFTNKNPGILPELVWLCNAIYKLTNLINGKCYVGQTVQVYSRFMCGNLSHLRAFEYQCRNNLTNYDCIMHWENTDVGTLSCQY